jgi:hypothetical protein
MVTLLSARVRVTAIHLQGTAAADESITTAGTGAAEAPRAT